MVYIPTQTLCIDLIPKYLSSVLTIFQCAKSGSSRGPVGAVRTQGIWKPAALVCSHTQPNAVTRVSITGLLHRPPNSEVGREGIQALVDLPATPPIRERVTLRKSLAISIDVHSCMSQTSRYCRQLQFLFRQGVAAATTTTTTRSYYSLSPRTSRLPFFRSPK
jgi:hypothetical protein